MPLYYILEKFYKTKMISITKYGDLQKITEICFYIYVLIYKHTHLFAENFCYDKHFVSQIVSFSYVYARKQKHE